MVLSTLKKWDNFSQDNLGAKYLEKRPEFMRTKLLKYVYFTEAGILAEADNHRDLVTKIEKLDNPGSGIVLIIGNELPYVH